MPTSAELITHLGLAVTTLAPLWRMEAANGAVAAYIQHTRDVTFDGTLYKASPVEISAVSSSLGLKTNNAALSSVFDSIVTRDDVEAGVWKNAVIELQYVNYLDLTMGSTGLHKGRAGKFDILNNIAYKVEFRSLASVLSQTIGALTSPTDRAAFPISTVDSVVDPANYTISRTVTAVTNRRIFTVGGATLTTDDYMYGLATWTGGDNDDLQMEIQENVGNLITLQLPMPNSVQVGDTVDLLLGYDGSRTRSRDTFSDAINLDSEPDLPGLRRALQFPD
jgi:uncharacterized phage protein (TIGR02218 family)